MAKSPTKPKTKWTMKEAIMMVSPGTALREGISLIIQSRLGALICIGPPKRLAQFSEQGVEIDAELTPQLLYELAKMDGAIVLNSDCSRIMYANRFLIADSSIPSNETGTRHRAGERTARKAKCVVIAVSERRSSVTLYVNDKRHVMDSIATLLNKASQAISTLEKYISVLDAALTDLSTREFEDMVTIFDVCKAVQRHEMVVRIAKEIEPFVLELGDEGRLIDMQLQELLKPLEESRLVVRDYFQDPRGGNFEAALAELDSLPQSDLLDLGHISSALGYGSNLKSIDTYLTPRGYRILTQTRRLTPQIIENLVLKFGTLQNIMHAPKEEVVEIDGIGEILAERIRLSLNSLRNQLALDRSRR
jgi:diadenylate cyclase